jgi:hypothetical protein
VPLANYSFLLNLFPENYVVRSVFSELLLRSPTKSEFQSWRAVIKNHGIAEFIKQIQSCEEKAIISTKIESQKILFMHIPKTAGASFRCFMNRFIKKTYTAGIDQDPNSLHDASFVSGHFGFAFMKSVTFTHSFTILRDPIERIISLYRFSRANLSGRHINDAALNHDFSSWISSNIPSVRQQIDSFYVRLMTDDISEPFETRVADSLPLALKRYSAFSAVGDQSNLKPFCKRVSSIFDINCTSLPLDNVSSHLTRSNVNYPSRPKLTQDDRVRLSHLTRYDYVIYNHFRSR